MKTALAILVGLSLAGCGFPNEPAKAPSKPHKTAWKQVGGKPCDDHGSGQPAVSIGVRKDGTQVLYAACPDGTIWRRKP